MVDQLSAKWLWDAAPKVSAIPHFNNLGARGVAFHSVCVNNPVCAPSRASLATGLRNRNHGVLQNGYELDPAIPAFMQGLQSGGWVTGSFGKVRHRAQYAGVHPDYRPYGFDVVFNTEDVRAGYWVAQEQPRH
jgi:choline-sulfatase